MLKKIRYREDILDNMGNDELIANLFRISQTEQKLKGDNIKSENDACITHHNVGKVVRKVMKSIEIVGTMPEDLPTPKQIIKRIRKRRIKEVRY